MNDGMSQVDTFDPKPMLNKHHGQFPQFLAFAPASSASCRLAPRKTSPNA
jgi:hypothetical protein